MTELSSKDLVASHKNINDLTNTLINETNLELKKSLIEKIEVLEHKKDDILAELKKEEYNKLLCKL